MSVWTDRDAIVLRWLHESPPSNEILRTTLGHEPHPDLPGLAQRDVHLAVETLIDDDLLHFQRRDVVLTPELHLDAAARQRSRPAGTR